METKAVNVNITIKVVNGGELSEWANSTMSIHGNAQGGINNLSPSHDCWLPTSQRELRHVERKPRLISARQNRQTNKKKKMPSVYTNDYRRSVHTESGKMWHFDLFVDVLPVVLAAARAST